MALQLSGSVYSPDDDVIRDDLRRPGPQFSPSTTSLSGKSYQLGWPIKTLLPMLRDAMGGEVEVEFALGMPPERIEEQNNPGPSARLYILQLRP